jgi:hypothetical protein
VLVGLEPARHLRTDVRACGERSRTGQGVAQTETTDDAGWRFAVGIGGPVTDGPGRPRPLVQRGPVRRPELLLW